MRAMRVLSIRVIRLRIDNMVEAVKGPEASFPGTPRETAATLPIVLRAGWKEALVPSARRSLGYWVPAFRRSVASVTKPYGACDHP